MNIGNLFVLLGVKGTDKASKDLAKTRNELVGISKRGLGAVAAIAGVSYGLKTLYDRSLRAGTGLAKFSNYTGESVEELQRWQYIARNSGISTDEVTSSVVRLQDALGNMHIDSEIGNALQQIGKEVNIDPSKMNDAFYMLQRFQEFAKKSVLPTNIANQFLSQFLTSDMIGMLRSTELTPDMVPNSALITGNQAKQLQKVQAAAANVQHQLEIAMMKLVSEVGPQLIKEFQNLIPNIIELTKVLSMFLGNFLKFWSSPLDNLKELGQGATDMSFWKELGRDLFPWTTHQLEQFAADGGIKGMNDRFSQNIMASQNPTGDIILNQTNNGVNFQRDADSLASKTQIVLGAKDKTKTSVKNPTKIN